MKIAWLCIIMSKSICSHGVEAVKTEVRRLAGDSYVDFCLVDDGFGEDCYAFVKCRVMGTFLDEFRRSPYVVSVLSSYDNPTYLEEDEVKKFITIEEEAPTCLSYGDMVEVNSEGVYGGLHGVTVFGGCEESQVLFRFHTVTRRVWLNNKDLKRVGSVFSYLKFPVLSDTFSRVERKYPVLEEAKIVGASEFNWGSYRPDKH